MNQIGKKLICNGESIGIVNDFHKLQIRSKLHVMESFYRTLNNCICLFAKTDDVVRHMGTPSSICFLKQKISTTNTNPGLQQIIPSMEIWSKEIYIQNLIFFVFNRTDPDFGFKLAREISHIKCKRFIVRNKKVIEQGGPCLDSCLINLGTTKEKFFSDSTASMLMLKCQKGDGIDSIEHSDGTELLDGFSSINLESRESTLPSPIHASTPERTIFTLRSGCLLESSAPSTSSSSWVWNENIADRTRGKLKTNLNLALAASENNSSGESILHLPVHVTQVQPNLDNVNNVNAEEISMTLPVNPPEEKKNKMPQSNYPVTRANAQGTSKNSESSQSKRPPWR